MHVNYFVLMVKSCEIAVFMLLIFYLSCEKFIIYIRLFYVATSSKSISVLHVFIIKNIGELTLLAIIFKKIFTIFSTVNKSIFWYI